jgi:hypothetical protein
MPWVVLLGNGQPVVFFVTDEDSAITGMDNAGLKFLKALETPALAEIPWESEPTTAKTPRALWPGMLLFDEDSILFLFEGDTFGEWGVEVKLGSATFGLDPD